MFKRSASCSQRLIFIPLTDLRSAVSAVLRGLPVTPVGQGEGSVWRLHRRRETKSLLVINQLKSENRCCSIGSIFNRY